MVLVCVECETTIQNSSLSCLTENARYICHANIRTVGSFEADPVLSHWQLSGRLAKLLCMFVQLTWTQTIFVAAFSCVGIYGITIDKCECSVNIHHNRSAN
jgi:hypothetical protein